jgi:tetratricopeptide (TPR) repeat protein
MTTPPQTEPTPQLEPSLLWTLSFARGYLELGMIREADRELGQLDLDDKCRSEVIDLRIQVLLARRQWRKADRLARVAIRMFPGLIEFYRHAANACEALGDVAEAKRTWCSVPTLFHQSGYFHYKIAGYEAQLGNADRAQEHVALALRLDPSIGDDLEAIGLTTESPLA